MSTWARSRTVITSYSIHYTKLYDFIVKNEYEAVNKARINGQETAHKEFRSFYTP